jgi:hypothetical protein
MTKTLDSAVITTLESNQFECAHLVELYLDAGTEYMTDSFYDIVYNSNTYSSANGLLGFEDITEQTEVVVGSVRITLAGAVPEIIRRCLDEPIINKRVIIRRAFYDAGTRNQVADPHMIFDGNISSYAINEDPAVSTISATAASHFANFRQVNSRITNSESQKETAHYINGGLFSADLGFEHASAMIQDLQWGQKLPKE